MINRILKTFLLFGFLWTFFLVGAAPRKLLDFDYFSYLLNQIESQSYFKPPDQKWLPDSLNKLHLQSPINALTQEDYTRVLKKSAPQSPEEQDRFLKIALENLIRALPDPYADFQSPREAAAQETQNHGQSYLGFGLLLSQHGNHVELSGTLPESPADLTGLSSGDFLVGVNGMPVHELRKVFKMIRAEKNHSLLLTLSHHGRILRYALKPAAIHLVPFWEKQLGKAGYIAMQVIPIGNDRLFLSAAQSFAKNGDTYLILDLRNCVGGEVTTAARIAGYFLNPGDLIYYQKTRAQRATYTNAVADHLNIPVYILTNHATASAAELISGALQDHKRAVVVGETTTGKGTVQTTWRLRDGSAMKFTTGIYLTPSGKKVSSVGIQPDLMHRWKKGESLSALESMIEKLTSK